MRDVGLGNVDFRLDNFAPPALGFDMPAGISGMGGGMLGFGNETTKGQEQPAPPEKGTPMLITIEIAIDAIRGGYLESRPLSIYRLTQPSSTMLSVSYDVCRCRDP